MNDQPICEAYYALAEFGLSTGLENLASIPGCVELQIDERWWFAANGHKVEHKCSRGVAVPPFHFYVVYNGWPAGIIGPYSGTIVAGDAANEDSLIAALKAAQSAGGSEPGSTKQRLDMLDQFEEAERISEHVSSLTETVPDQGKDDG